MDFMSFEIDIIHKNCDCRECRKESEIKRFKRIGWLDNDT